MREILFRGKRDYDCKWIHGAYISYSSTKEAQSHSIIPTGNRTLFYRVTPETVGQYTGIDDKKGNKLFEGDIVDILTEGNEIGVVEWLDGAFIVKADGFCVDFLNNINGTDIIIVGNIYDNPELLKG